MEGFGSLDIVSSFSYGSVEDGYKQNPTFEQRLRKQYWKTKHTVRQKFKKNEDEYVVASDAEIDVKLEVFYILYVMMQLILQSCTHTHTFAYRKLSTYRCRVICYCKHWIVVVTMSEVCSCLIVQ